MGTRPTISLLAVETGLSASEVGVLVAVFSLGPLLATVPAGHWMDRHGNCEMLYASVALTVLGLALPWLVPGRPGLYASQFITGCGFTFHVLGAQKTVGDDPLPEVRERDIANFSLSVAIGSFVGPFLMGLAGEHLGLDTAMMLAAPMALVALAILPFVRFRRPAPGAGPKVRQSPNPLRVFGYHRYMGRAFLISSLVLLGKDFYLAYFPLLASGLGISTAWIGIIIAIHNGGGVVMRLFQLALVRRFGKSPVIITSIMISGIFFALIPLGQGLAALTLMSLIVGLGLGLGQPLSISTTVNLSPPDKTGEVLGLRLTCNRLTQFTTPLAFGAVVAFGGIAGAFIVVGTILAAGSLRLNIPDPRA